MGGIVGQKPTRPPGSPKTSGSGRKKGTLNKATVAFNEAVNLLKLDREGKPMAAIMIEAARWFYGVAASEQAKGTNGDQSKIGKLLIVAAKIAHDAAPYLYPTAVKLGGDPNNPLEVVTRIERVIIDAHEDVADRDSAGLPTTH
jgi:hypothetical protein